MNSLKIRLKDKASEISVNGTRIDKVTAYEVKQDATQWGARVKIEFIADGEIDLNINPTALPQ